MARPEGRPSLLFRRDMRWAEGRPSRPRRSDGVSQLLVAGIMTFASDHFQNDRSEGARRSGTARTGVRRGH